MSCPRTTRPEIIPAMERTMTCEYCGQEFRRQKAQKFCSVKCGAMNRGLGMKAHRLDEPRMKACAHFGEMFGMRRCQNNIAKFRTRRFCSTCCSAPIHRPKGDDHPASKPNPRNPLQPLTVSATNSVRLPRPRGAIPLQNDGPERQNDRQKHHFG